MILWEVSFYMLGGSSNGYLGISVGVALLFCCWLSSLGFKAAAQVKPWDPYCNTLLPQLEEMNFL